MKTLVALPLLVVMVAVMAGKHSVKFSFNVKEKQAHFKQDVEADFYNNHAYFKTPAHNDVTETFKIQDFNKGIQLSCMPLIHECHVFSIDRTTYPHPGKLIIDAHSSSKNLTDTTALLKTYLWAKTSRIQNTDSFSKEMAAFYQRFNYPLFLLEKIQNSSLIIGGTILKRNVVSLVDKVEQLLLKERNGTTLCSGNTPSIRYGYTGTSDCDYLTFCDGLAKRTIETDPFVRRKNSTVGSGGHCMTKHVRNNVFYQCLCCPGAHNVADCLYCNDLSKHMTNFGLPGN